MSALLDLAAGPGEDARPGGVVGRRTSLVTLCGVELRKAVDTRAGRVLLAIVVGLGVAALAYEVWSQDAGPVGAEDFLGGAIQAVLLVLPVLGVLAMTSEWTQRTSLWTFTLVPQRSRVLVAKVTAALVLASVAVGLVVAATAGAMWLAGVLSGGPVVWEGLGRLAAGALAACLLQVLMAVAIGAVVPHSAAAVTIFLVLPTLWTNAGVSLFGDAAGWLDVFAAGARISRFDWTDYAQTVTALLVWVVVPFLLGMRANLRREVK